VIRHGQRRFGSVRILPYHRDMIPDPDNMEPEILKCSYYPGLGDVLGKFHLYGNLGNEGLDKIAGIVCVLAK
jgi:hypothetical protein